MVEYVCFFGFVVKKSLKVCKPVNNVSLWVSVRKFVRELLPEDGRLHRHYAILVLNQFSRSKKIRIEWTNLQ